MNQTNASDKPTGKTHLFDNPNNVQRLLVLFYICCGLLVLADFIVHRHSAHPWDKLPSFYALYGFVGCVALVVAAKVLRRWVMRGEDYYETATTAKAESDSEASP